VEAYGPQALTQQENVDTLVSLANQAASALENARLYEELAQREHQLRELVGRMLVAQEEERRRVAYDIHDGLAQQAAAAHQHLQGFAKRHSPATARGQKELDLAVELIQQAVREARHVIADLRPTTLDDFGLAAALRLQAEKLGTEGLQVSYEETLGDERPPATVETTLYRVAQEALTNVRKHAQSPRVHVKLERLDRTIRLEVRDWGKGFEADQAKDGNGPGERIGLSSMQDRVTLLGGDLRVHSRPQAGTSIVAEVPLLEEESNREG
jgi:signal transduction histidine kinase